MVLALDCLVFTVGRLTREEDKVSRYSFPGSNERMASSSRLEREGRLELLRDLTSFFVSAAVVGFLLISLLIRKCECCTSSSKEIQKSVFTPRSCATNSQPYFFVSILKQKPVPSDRSLKNLSRYFLARLFPSQPYKKIKNTMMDIDYSKPFYDFQIQSILSYPKIPFKIEFPKHPSWSDEQNKTDRFTIRIPYSGSVIQCKLNHYMYIYLLRNYQSAMISYPDQLNS